MNRRMTALFLAVCLLAGAASLSSAGAAPAGLNFICLNDTLLDVSKQPYYAGQQIYVPGDIFSYFGIYYTYFTESQVVSVWTEQTQYYFELTSGNTYDQNDVYYSAQAVYYNGQPVVPLFFICASFGLSWSFVQGNEYGTVLRIMDSRVVLTDAQFVSAASQMMKNAYNSYYGSVETPLPTLPPVTPAVSPTPTPYVPPVTPFFPVTPAVTPTPAVTAGPSPDVSPSPGPTEEPIPSPTPSLPPDRWETEVYLCFMGIPEAAVLRTLRQREMPFAVFLTEEQILSSPDEVRALSAEENCALGAFCERGQDYEAISLAYASCARLTTLLMTSLPEHAARCARYAGDHTLVYWTSGVCARPGEEEERLSSAGELLSAIDGSTDRADVLLLCPETETSVVFSVITHLVTDHFTVSPIRETNAPGN